MFMFQKDLPRGQSELAYRRPWTRDVRLIRGPVSYGPSIVRPPYHMGSVSYGPICDTGPWRIESLLGMFPSADVYGSKSECLLLFHCAQMFLLLMENPDLFGASQRR